MVFVTHDFPDIASTGRKYIRKRYDYLSSSLTKPSPTCSDLNMCSRPGLKHQRKNATSGTINVLLLKQTQKFYRFILQLIHSMPMANFRQSDSL